MKIGITGPVLTEPLKDYLVVKGDNYPKGLGGSSVVELIKSLHEKGYEVIVYSLDPAVSKPTVIEGGKLKIYYGPFRASNKMHDLMKLERDSIKDLINMDKPDIIHANWTYEFTMGALETGIPTLITIHDWAPKILKLNKDLYRLGRLYMQYISIRNGKYFSAVSPYIKEKVEKYYKKNVELIPNGISRDKLIPIPRKMNGEKIILGFGHGLRGIKNLIALIKAFTVIRKVLPLTRLNLIGPGTETGGEVYEYCKANQITDNINFLGVIQYENIWRVYQNADLLIHPSLEESFGNAIIEAMASRIPVIGGVKSGAVPWLLDYGKAGILADITNPEDIAQNAVDVLIDEIKWQKYSGAGYDRAFNYFNQDIVTDKYLELYEKIIRMYK